MSLRRRVQGLVAAAVVPLSLLLIYDAYTISRHLAAEAESTALDEARLLAGSIEALIDGAHQAATAIAAHVESDAGLTDCAAYLQTIVTVEPRYFSAAVIGADGELRCSNVQLARPISVADRSYFHAALNADGLVVGELVYGRARDRPALPLARAYRNPNGDALGIVLLPVDVAALARTIGTHVSRARGFAAVIDSGGVVAAYVPDHEAMVGQHFAPETLATWRAEAPRVVEHSERGRVYIAGLVHVNVPPAGLLVVVGLDRVSTLAPARAALVRSLALAALAVAAAALGAWLAGLRLIEAPVQEFVATAQRRAAGDLGAHFPETDRATEFARLGAALNHMAAEIDRLVAQKSLLLRELQHRVMNSLQLLSAFLHLQARQVPDPTVRRHLEDTRERIASMSAIYRQLYESEGIETIDFADALRALCHETARAFLDGDERLITVEADSVELPVERALTLALIAHELLTNALKHAYERGGPLQVVLARRAGGLELSVIDEGRGLPAGFSFESGGSLGMTVVRTLARQLHGTVDAERRTPGTCFVVRVPLDPPAGRPV